MSTATRKLRSPLKWHGGKSYLARRIIALMPPHRVYHEPFLGGGSVLLNKPIAKEEHVSDIDENLMRLWLAIQEHTQEFLEYVREITYSLDSWLEWGDLDAPKWGLVSQAVQYLVRNRFSRGGLGKTFAWSDRLRGGQPGDVNAWETIKAELPRIAERIADVKLDCGSAVELIGGVDGPDTLHYCDPPYFPTTRTVRKAYAHEMNDLDHFALLDTLNQCRGLVVLSGYDCQPYRDRLVDWERHEFDMPNHSGQGKSKQRRVECLWIKR